MNYSQQRQALARSERLYLDPDYDLVYGYRDPGVKEEYPEEETESP